MLNTITSEHKSLKLVSIHLIFQEIVSSGWNALDTVLGKLVETDTGRKVEVIWYDMYDEDRGETKSTDEEVKGVLTKLLPTMMTRAEIEEAVYNEGVTWFNNNPIPSPRDYALNM